jgi:hypothetical protein
VTSEISPLFAMIAVDESLAESGGCLRTAVILIAAGAAVDQQMLARQIRMIGRVCGRVCDTIVPHTLLQLRQHLQRHSGARGRDPR